MKKTYIIPQIEVIQIQTSHHVLLNASMPIGDETDKVEGRYFDDFDDEEY